MSKQECSGYKIVGKIKDASLYNEYDFIVAIGDSKIREKIYRKLERNKLNIVSLIHRNAIVADNVQMKKGTVVMAGAVINPNVLLGEGCIVNTSSSIDHDCIIGDFVHVSVGAHIAGSVKIGNGVFIGAGVIIINNRIIINNVTVGAGAVVVKDLMEIGTYIGVPANKRREGIK